jgi:prophage regulatory protein
MSENIIIRFPALGKKLGGVSRSTIDRWVNSKDFPKKIQLGKNSVGWLLKDIEEWLKNRSS